MLKLAKLELEINKILKLEVVYSHPLSNYLYNDYWVTDLYHYHFNEFEKEVEELIDTNIDYDDELNLNFIRDLLNDVTIFYKDLINIYDDFSSFDFSNEIIGHLLDSPDNSDLFPLFSVRESQSPNPSNKYEDKFSPIIEIIKQFFNIPEDKELNSLVDLNEFLIKNHNVSEMELDEIYAKAHLTYILSLHIGLVARVGQLFNSILKVRERRMFNINDSLFVDKGIENVRLNFNLSKTHLGHLFYNLYEIGMIAKDPKDTDDTRTELKNYLNSANMYYLDNKKKFAKADKMNRVMRVDRYPELRNCDDELQFLEYLIDKLNDRVSWVQEKRKNLVERGYKN